MRGASIYQTHYKFVHLFFRLCTSLRLYVLFSFSLLFFILIFLYFKIVLFTVCRFSVYLMAFDYQELKGLLTYLALSIAIGLMSQLASRNFSTFYISLLRRLQHTFLTCG